MYLFIRLYYMIYVWLMCLNNFYQVHFLEIILKYIIIFELRVRLKCKIEQWVYKILLRSIVFKYYLKQKGVVSIHIGLNLFSITHIRQLLKLIHLYIRDSKFNIVVI